MISRISAALIALGWATGAALAATPKVVVTIKPIHALVAGIMEGVGKPVLLVEGSASPHTFVLRPSTARAINEADVFIRVSERLEPFTRKISGSLPASVRVVTLEDGPHIKLLSQRIGGTFEPHHHEHAGGAHGAAEDDDDDGPTHADGAGFDPHIWLDPENAKAIVANVASALSERYPDDAAKFSANAARLTGKLDELEKQLSQKLAPVKGRPFVVFHDATQYFERRFGLDASGSITVSPDVPPSARRLTDLRRKIEGLGAVCIFAEPNFQPNLVAAVTEGTRAKSGTIDAEGQGLSPNPNLYFELMQTLGDALVKCLAAPG